MDSSPFSSLSPELRNLIYIHTFTSPYAITLAPETTYQHHPLTQTCRKIRQEAHAMFYSLTHFNAHLDDGPSSPLANWLTALGPEIVQNIREVNVWVCTRTARDDDMHMLNGTLHGPESTARLLFESPDPGQKYILKPVGDRMTTSRWYLDDVIVALEFMGLGLLRFCVIPENGDESDIKLTSEFAIVKPG